MRDLVYVSPILAAFFAIIVLSTLNKLSLLALVTIVLVTLLALLGFLLVNICIRITNAVHVDIEGGSRTWRFQIKTPDQAASAWGTTDWNTNWNDNPETITVVE